MSARTAKQSASLDSFRVVKAREAAILRAQAYRRAALFILMAVALVSGAAVVCTVAVTASDQAVQQHGRVR